MRNDANSLNKDSAPLYSLINTHQQYRTEGKPRSLFKNNAWCTLWWITWRLTNTGHGSAFFLCRSCSGLSSSGWPSCKSKTSLRRGFLFSHFTGPFLNLSIRVVIKTLRHLCVIFNYSPDDCQDISVIKEELMSLTLREASKDTLPVSYTHLTLPTICSV